MLSELVQSDHDDSAGDAPTTLVNENASDPGSDDEINTAGGVYVLAIACWGLLHLTDQSCISYSTHTFFFAPPGHRAAVDSCSPRTTQHRGPSK